MVDWIREAAEVNEENRNEEAVEEAWDDVKGGSLPVELVKEARSEEVGFMEKRGIWEVRSREECLRVTGKPPVSVKSVSP